MNFRCLTVQDQVFGNEDGFRSAMTQLSNVNFHDSKFEYIMNNVPVTLG